MFYLDSHITAAFPSQAYVVSIAQLDTHTTSTNVMIWLVNAVYISSFYRHVDCNISARVSLQCFEGTLHLPQTILL